MTMLLTALRGHLIDHGIVRKPGVAGAAPPMFLEPQTGVRAPGEANNPTEDGDPIVAAFLSGGFAPQPFASWHRQPIIDVRFRTTKAQYAELVELDITKALIDKRDWMMGAVGDQIHVIESQQWRALQRLGSDEQGFEYVASYVFELPRP